MAERLSAIRSQQTCNVSASYFTHHTKNEAPNHPPDSSRRPIRLKGAGVNARLVGRLSLQLRCVVNCLDLGRRWAWPDRGHAHCIQFWIGTRRGSKDKGGWRPAIIRFDSKARSSQQKRHAWANKIGCQCCKNHRDTQSTP